jgi:lysophospholipase L1-like esterase
MCELLVRIIPFPEEELSQILNVLQQDSVLFWRLRPNLDIMFHGARVKTGSTGLRIKDCQFKLKKDNNVFRIVCLGGSSTFGWAVTYKDAYPYQLEHILRQDNNVAKSIEVINGGVIGYTSYQGVLFLKSDILKLKPDMIIVSYMVNDIDKHRFYRNNGRSDKEVSPKHKALLLFENVIDRSRLCRFLRIATLHKRGIDTRFYDIITQNYPETRRVSPANYRNNLDALVEIAKLYGIKVVFLQMKIDSPVPLKDIDASLKNTAEEYIASALRWAQSQRYDEAILELGRALQYNPYSVRGWYYLGMYFYKKHMPEKAAMYFQKAKEMELLECVTLSKEYNRIMQDVAIERGIPCVDTVTVFEKYMQEKKESLFVNPGHDLVHPNTVGHRLIAETLADSLIQYKYVPTVSQERTDS